MNETAAISPAFEFDDSLTGAPPEYLTPAVPPSLSEAQAYCKELAEAHYENFHVATWFLPRHLRPHFQTIYAYSRIADDLGDEIDDPALSIKLLNAWGFMLQQAYDAPQRSRHPVFVALAETIRSCNLPTQPFLDLLTAFRIDQTVVRYETLEQFIEYSRCSANPVGHLVLYACGYDDPELRALSDKVCTGLQLANMWQDVGNDFDRGRVYLPAVEMRRLGITTDQIAMRRTTPEFRILLASLVDRTRAMLVEGSAICDRVDAELRVTLQLFVQGGHAILDAIECIDYDVLRHRPVVTKMKKASLLLNALIGKTAAALFSKERIA